MTKEKAADAGESSNSIETTVPPKSNTGRTFRDGIRKIDLILVVKDEENIIADALKNIFLTNIVKTGLQIEFESGVLPIHNKLIFFKLYCPNDVLNNLGNAFGVKCVQSGRAERIMSDKERDWINVLRKEYAQPLQYSSLERSLVVYMALLNVPFGDRQNFIGLERLMKRNIVIDAYALHDGPYFIPQDASSINARQILFYNWAGITNIFTRQPLNVVHEYFGPKIALYFAYYELYNLFLTIASIAALTTFILSIYGNDNYMGLRTSICQTKEGVCADCVADQNMMSCSYFHISNFCNWHTMNVIMDNKYTPFFATFIILWGMFFTSYWFGRERYLNWVWKANNKDYNRKHIRPGCEVTSETSRKSNVTGIAIVKPSNYKINIILCYIGIILLNMFIFFFILNLEITLRTYLPKTFTMLLFYTMIGFAIVVFFIDYVHTEAASYVVWMENHKTYVSYGRSLAIHLYVMCCLPIVLTLYYGFQWGVFDFLVRRGYKKDDEHLIEDTCLMTSCINKLTIAFTVVLLVRFVMLRKFVTNLYTTDYNQGAIVEDIPCWEREYVLPPFKETNLANNMKLLVMQFTLIIAFGFACPPAILIVLLFNVIDMRRDAKWSILYYRRPLLLKNKSFNVWTDILKVLVYLAIVLNVVTFICSTDAVERYLLEQRKPTGNTLEHYLKLFFLNITAAGAPCYARAYIHISKDYAPSRQDLTSDELKTYQYMYIFLFEIIMAAIFLRMQNIFTSGVGEQEIPKKGQINDIDNEDKTMNNVSKTNSVP